MINLSKIAISLRPLLSFAWRMLLTLTICRTVFVAWQWDRVVAADMLASIYVQGIRFDLVLLGLMLVVPVLAYPVLASNRLLIPAWRGLLKICLPGVLLIIVFLECSTPSFVDQFDSRPNILFLEYLNHPREIAATLWAAYKIPILITILLVAMTTWFNSRQLSRLVKSVQPVGIVPAILVTPVLLLLVTGMVRSTMDHRPVNPSTVALSSVPLVTEVVPVERFHIHGLILGGAISSKIIDPVASQIDLAPTLLSLIGVAAEHPMIGHDLTRSDALLSPGRAIMQFNATQAYLEGDRVAVLQKDTPIRQFRDDNAITFR